MTTAHASAPTYYRLYVWEAPVRLFHWVNAGCILLLAVTGFLIGSPHVVIRSAEAYQQYWFGWVRFVHFTAAYLLLFNFMMRIYWGFTGDQYARWHHYFPLSKRQRREIWDVLRVDILLTRDDVWFSSGHNAVAGLAYLLLFIAMALSIITGFSLYAPMSDAWVPSLFAWVVPLMGGDATVRFWHHTLMWAFVIFTMIHLYLVAYHDYVEGRATASSIVGGWKFARTERFEPGEAAAASSHGSSPAAPATGAQPTSAPASSETDHE